MAYEHRISVDTPEGVRLEVPVAGLGSRAAATTIDGILEAIVMGALVLAAFALLPEAAPLAIPIVTTTVFLTYDTLFEVRRSGRTPGKRAVGIRVVQHDGSPVTFRASAVRNLVRLLDVLPVGYVVGAVTVLVTRDGQRLGDLAAGTLVVRERQGSVAGERPSPLAAHLVDELDTWDVTGLTREDVVAISRFLERRATLTGDARRRLAAQLADRLRQRIVAPSAHHDDEVFLQQLVAARSARDAR